MSSLTPTSGVFTDLVRSQHSISLDTCLHIYVFLVSIAYAAFLPIVAYTLVCFFYWLLVLIHLSVDLTIYVLHNSF